FGVSGATATMVGNNIGRGLNNRAQTYAYRAMFLCLIVGLLLTLSLCCWRLYSCGSMTCLPQQ
ncbi:MATE family efflux transporter, partial [Phascolarctobacterium faecium]|uniref:MATE family efflux transporter n=1 Tax=Phascolarctobacterium faecium TaxID=33025 RepID=UPI00399A1644